MSFSSSADTLAAASPVYSAIASPRASSLSSLANGAAKLKPMAEEFESILLGQWLSSAENSFGSVPGGDDDADAGDEQMKSFAVQQLAKGFTQSGGIGIAQIVSKALDHASQQAGQSSSSSQNRLPLQRP